MAIIYRYINKINGKSYVGQTVSPHLRKNFHRTAPFNPNSKDYEKVFYRAIRKYGWDNFDYEVLEECETAELEKYEQLYMDEFDSIRNGYNVQLAEEGRQWTEERKKYLSEISKFKNASLDFEDVVYIRQSYLIGESPSEVYLEFEDIFSHYYSFLNVWTGSRYGYVMPEVFTMRQKHTKLNYEKAEEIRMLYKDIPSYAKIAKIYDIGVATVRDVIKFRTWKPKEPVSTISG